MQRCRAPHPLARHSVLCATLLAGLWGFSTSSHADTYVFAGVIDTNHTSSPVLNISQFSGQFSFNPLQPDLAAADTDNGAYPMNSLLYGMQVSFDDGTVFTVDPLSGYSLNVHVALASLPGQTPDVGRLRVRGDVAGTNDRFLDLRLEKNFLTDELPAPPGGFTLADFDKTVFSYHGLDSFAPPPGELPPPSFGATGHLTSLQCLGVCGALAVPEPTGAVLALCGLGVLGLFRRRLPGRVQAH